MYCECRGVRRLTVTGAGAGRGYHEQTGHSHSQHSQYTGHSTLGTQSHGDGAKQAAIRVTRSQRYEILATVICAGCLLTLFPLGKMVITPI